MDWETSGSNWHVLGKRGLDKNRSRWIQSGTFRSECNSFLQERRLCLICEMKTTQTNEGTFHMIKSWFWFWYRLSCFLRICWKLVWEFLPLVGFAWLDPPSSGLMRGAWSLDNVRVSIRHCRYSDLHLTFEEKQHVWPTRAWIKESSSWTGKF